MKINSVSNQNFGQIHVESDQKQRIYASLNAKEKRIFDFVDTHSDNVAQIRIIDDGYIYVRSGNKRANFSIFEKAKNLNSKFKIALKFIANPEKFEYVELSEDDSPRDSSRTTSVRNSDGDSYYCGEAIAPPVGYFGCGW